MYFSVQSTHSLTISTQSITLDDGGLACFIVFRSLVNTPSAWVSLVGVAFDGQTGGWEADNGCPAVTD